MPRESPRDPSSGRSPCTLITASKARSGSSCVIASWMRSEPVGWSGSVITARPPAASTASAIARSPQATTTGPISAAIARRQTCTIIGTPPISASGLPGRRVAASRAGIRMIGFCGAALVTEGLRSRSGSDNMPGSDDRRKRDNLLELSGGKAVDVVFRVEQNHRLGADGNDPRDGLGDSRDAARAPEGARKAGLSTGRRRSRSRPRRRSNPRRQSSSRSNRCSPRPIRSAASSSPRFASYATPSTKAARTRSGRTSGMLPRRGLPPSRTISSLRHCRRTRAQSGTRKS